MRVRIWHVVICNEGVHLASEMNIVLHFDHHSGVMLNMGYSLVVDLDGECCKLRPGLSSMSRIIEFHSSKSTNVELEKQLIGNEGWALGLTPKGRQCPK